MKKIVLFLPLILIAGMGYWYMHTIPHVQRPDDLDGSEEHVKKAQWLHDMQADPATGEIPEGIRSKELAFLSELQREYRNEKKTRASWRFRGPNNVGGRTRAVAIDVTNENHIIAGSVSGGLWQSFNGGESWNKVTTPAAHPGIVSICQDTRPGKTNMWYALSGELTGTSASGGGAFYLGDGALFSQDYGYTWTPITATAAGVPSSFSTVYQGGWRMVSSPKVDSLNTCLYMATYGSIFRSIDTGKTWQAVLGSGNDSYYTDVAVSPTGVVYATLSSDGTTKGIFRSANGVNFTNITPSFFKNYNRIVLDINPNNENEVYFLSELEKDSSGGVITTNYEGTKEYVALLKYNYVSGNGADTGGVWTNLSSNLPVNDPDQFDKFNCQGGYDLLVKVQPQTNHVIIGGTNLYISKDAFATGTKISQFGGYAVGTQLDNFGVYASHHPDQHDIVFFKSNPNKLLSCSDGGVKLCNNVNADQVTWKDISIGYNTSQLYTVAIDEKNAYDQWLLAGLQDNGNYLSRSNNATAPWNMTINGDGSYNYIASDKSFCVISTQLGNVRKVELDQKGNVLKRKRIDPSGYDKSMYNFINCITVDPNNDNYMYMPIGKRVAIMNNLRKLPVVQDNNKLTYGWTVTSDTITTAGLSATSPGEITVIAVSKNPANVVYVGTNNREVYKLENPTSSNPTFKKLSITRLPSGGYVNDILIDPDDANKVFVVYSNYNVTSVLYSTNGGGKWNFAGGNLEGSGNSSGTNPSIRCINQLKHPDGHVTYFLGTSIGLFSTDSLNIDTVGSTNPTIWTQESPELIGANVVMDIKTRESDGYVVVATHGNGAFESYYTGKTMPTANTIVSSSSLYPNPAYNQVNFSFTSIKDDIATAVIVDMMGRKVSTLFNAKFNPGPITYPADISTLASGNYRLLFYTSSLSKPVVHNFIKL